MSEIAVVNRNADTLAAEINGIKEQVRATMVTGAIEIGRRLKEAKSLVPYGEWGAWLKENVDYSERTAQNMMRIADEYGRGEPQALAQISVTQAVLLLGVPAEEREAFAESHDIGGMSTRELQAAVDALKAEKERMQLTIDELMGAVQNTEADKGEVAQMEAKVKEAQAQLHEAETRHAAALRAEGEKLKHEKAARDKLAGEKHEAARQVEMLKKQVQRLNDEVNEARANVREVEVVPQAVTDELTRLRAQSSRSSAETELRAAFDSLKDAYTRLMQKLGDVEGEVRAKYGAAFAKGLRMMAERVEGDRE